MSTDAVVTRKKPKAEQDAPPPGKKPAKGPPGRGGRPDDPLAKLAHAAAHAVVTEFAVYAVPKSIPKRIAKLLQNGDVVWRSATPCRELVPPRPRQLKIEEQKDIPFLCAVWKSLRRDQCLYVYVWPDGTVILTLTEHDHDAVDGWLWEVVNYEAARNAPRLAEWTAEKDADPERYDDLR